MPEEPNQNQTPTPQPSPASPQEQIITPIATPPNPSEAAPQVPTQEQQITTPTPQVINPSAVPSPAPISPTVINDIQTPPPLNTSPQQPLAPISEPGGKKKTLLVVGGGAVILAILISVGLFMALAAANRVTAGEVQSAQSTANSLVSDINNIYDTSGQMVSDTSQSQVTSDAKSVSGSLADAQKLVGTLTSSKVQHNSSVHTAFQAFAAKWPAYKSYMAETTTDLDTLVPSLVDFENQMQTLTASSPTTNAQLATYLTNYKNIITGMSQKLSSMHMSNSNDAQIVSACQTMLQSSSKDVSQAQSDLSKGNYAAADNDLLNVQDAEATFNTTETSIEDAANSKLQKMDPTDQLNAFQDALTKLSSQLGK